MYFINVLALKVSHFSTFHVPFLTYYEHIQTNIPSFLLGYVRKLGKELRPVAQGSTRGRNNNHKPKCADDWELMQRRLLTMNNICSFARTISIMWWIFMEYLFLVSVLLKNYDLKWRFGSSVWYRFSFKISLKVFLVLPSTKQPSPFYRLVLSIILFTSWFHGFNLYSVLRFSLCLRFSNMLNCFGLFSHLLARYCLSQLHHLPYHFPFFEVSTEK